MKKIVLFSKGKKKNFVDLNEKTRRGKKKGGGVSDSWLDVRKGGRGSFRCIQCVTGGGGGGVKNPEKCVCN